MLKSEQLRKLADLRVSTRWPGYKQPECYGYHFEDLVSPYTRTAGNVNADVMFLLQDWSSDNVLKKGIDPVVASRGYTPTLKTNRRLKELLSKHFGLELHQTYGTNVFPFIKKGGISSHIPMKDMVRAAEMFALPQIQIVKPRVVLALGSETAKALRKAGAQVHRIQPRSLPFLHCQNVVPDGNGLIFELPHPAAWTISDKDMNSEWRAVHDVVSTAQSREAELTSTEPQEPTPQRGGWRRAFPSVVGIFFRSLLAKASVTGVAGGIVGGLVGKGTVAIALPHDTDSSTKQRVGTITGACAGAAAAGLLARATVPRAGAKVTLIAAAIGGIVGGTTGRTR